MTGYAFFIEYGLNLGIKVYRCLPGVKNKKNNDRNDWDKHKNYLP
jgi:hypothetical protein